MRKPRLAFTLVALPALVAVLVNCFSIGVAKAYGEQGPGTVDMLVWASVGAGVLIGSSVGWRSSRGAGPAADSLWLGFAAAVVTFVLSWVPLVVALALQPPT